MSKIFFNPSSEEHSIVVPPPKPASLYKSEWWKESPAFYDTQDLYKTYAEKITIKHCVPFRDLMFAGYIQESWQDIHFDVSQDGLSVDYTFPMEPAILSHRDIVSMPVGEEFLPFEFTIKVPWMPATPPGWSVLVTQPFNRPELPFYSPGGIIDTDTLNNTAGPGNFPIYLKKNAPKIIKAGTPLYQIIPFKRDPWESVINDYDSVAHQKIFATLKKSFWGGYKKFFWQKKTYL